MSEILLPDGTIMRVPCTTGEVSDGYHTFDELYEHRHALFLCLMHAYHTLAWKSRTHADGTSIDGWFIAGMQLPTGHISYHLPIDLWDSTEVLALPQAPPWGGHTSETVLARLFAFAKMGR